MSGLPPRVLRSGRVVAVGAVGNGQLRSGRTLSSRPPPETRRKANGEDAGDTGENQPPSPPAQKSDTPSRRPLAPVGKTPTVAVKKKREKDSTNENGSNKKLAATPGNLYPVFKTGGTPIGEVIAGSGPQAIANLQAPTEQARTVDAFECGTGSGTKPAAGGEPTPSRAPPVGKGSDQKIAKINTETTNLITTGSAGRHNTIVAGSASRELGAWEARLTENLLDQRARWIACVKEAQNIVIHDATGIRPARVVHAFVNNIAVYAAALCVSGFDKVRGKYEIVSGKEKDLMAMMLTSECGFNYGPEGRSKWNNYESADEHLTKHKKIGAWLMNNKAKYRKNKSWNVVNGKVEGDTKGVFVEYKDIMEKMGVRFD